MGFQPIFISIFFNYLKNNQHYIVPINIISIFLFIFLQNTQKILPKNTNDHFKNIISIFVLTMDLEFVELKKIYKF